MCVINRVNFDRVVKHNTWGVAEHFKRNLQRTEVSDFLLFYIYGEQVIGGAFEVKKGPYRDSRTIFVGGSYPHRVGISPVLLPKEPLPFSPDLRAKLRFITNKVKWAGHLRQAMRNIPKEDYELLIKNLEKPK